MTVFVLLAIALTALCVAFLLWPLLKARREADVDRASANLGILKDQLAELEAEHGRGAVSAEHYTEAKAELERRVIEEVQAGAPTTTAGKAAGRSWSAKVAAAVLAVAVPVTAGLIYARLGDPAAFDPLLAKGGDDAHALAPEQIEKMLESLRERLKREPDNANGWATLARTYYSMGRFPQAAEAYKELVRLFPDDADILADYADSLAMARGRRISGEPMELVNKALRLNPNQWKALAMAGTEAFDRKDFKAAVNHWERLYNTLPPGAPIAEQIARSIADAREAGGMPPAQLASRAEPAKSGAGAMPPDHPPVAAGAGSAPKPEAQPKGAASVGNAMVAGTIDIGGDLKAKASPTDRVFIFARPAEGSRMPLALTSVQVKDLPAKFTLDESMAMSPNLTLANASDIIVGARVSKSGQPMPSSGDLEGLSTPVKVGAKDVVVKIDRVLP